MSQVPVILLGAGGHAKVVLDLLQALERRVLGICDPVLAAQGADIWRGLPVLGDDTIINRYEPASIELANGTGSLPGKPLRRRLHAHFNRLGYRFATLVHPHAHVGSGVKLGQGVQLMAGVIVQADTCLGDDVILNTGARVDHDSVIGDHVHLAPGAVLSGNVQVGEGGHIGPGATVIHGVRIGVGAIVGAGTTVVRDIPAWHQQTGQPARKSQEIHTESKNT
ncbi:UDP-perosamine 4-acetyltransferase [Modicisalibacter ilicicola DSM 19980]|uniref:UDP-perosamine 4-acetyltransferase n=1 Tax=Modicisalibacter ilicicola DSM 19980 TaxID=1121942 RepID=A0A1M5ENM5_9GAMM|nr:acetyltransferase [Halomonas ilicicola]SHF80893.1 UDP-perosamine 4-acetyltransferase [Halomonas ilicicola DSM 19980]